LFSSSRFKTCAFSAFQNPFFENNWFEFFDVEMIFPGGSLWDFTKIFLREGKSGEIFFLLEIKKTTFFAEIFKIQGACPPF